MMKKTLFLILALVISITACASPEATPNPAGDTRPALTDPFTPMEVPAGETFNIVMETNPSTGYQWQIVSELSNVEFISTEYTTDEPVLAGSGGVDVWTFKALSNGEVKITFGYFSPGGTEPEQTVTYHIIVK